MLVFLVAFRLLSGCFWVLWVIFWLLLVVLGCFCIILRGICCGRLCLVLAVAVVLLRMLFAVISVAESVMLAFKWHHTD
jgi:hypothetical protein